MSSMAIFGSMLAFLYEIVLNIGFWGIIWSIVSMSNDNNYAWVIANMTMAPAVVGGFIIGFSTSMYAFVLQRLP